MTESQFNGQGFPGAVFSRAVNARQLSPLQMIMGLVVTVVFLFLGALLLIPVLLIGAVVIVFAIGRAKWRMLWQSRRESQEEPQRENVRVIPPEG